mgnify:FL=1
MNTILPRKRHSLAQQWGVETNFGKGKRIPKAKKHFDELCDDSRLTDPEMRFKVNVVYRTLDILINQVVHRFRGMQVVVDTFGILHPRELTAATDDQLFTKATKLQQQYSNDIAPSFFEQLQSFRMVLKQEIKKINTIKELSHLLIIENSSLATSLPDVCTAYLLFLTLPVTVATAERSFSKLKLIKNYLRSTMLQDRLSGLAILSIENENAKKMDVDELVNIFAEKKCRRKKYRKYCRV